MMTFILKHIKYSSAYESDGPARVDAAEWFLRKMRSGRKRERILDLWGMGSDMIYYKPWNVKDRPSKERLNRIAEEMIEICQNLGCFPHVPTPAFDLDSST